MQDIYIIPDNFISEEKLLNGMFKAKNLIEAVLFSAATVFLLLLLPIQNLRMKFSLCSLIASPIFAVFISGVNGDSFLTFLLTFLRFEKKKRVLLYNDHISNNYLFSEIETDKKRKEAVQKIKNLMRGKKKKELESPLVEGINFEFLETEFDLMQSERKDKPFLLKKNAAKEEGGFILSFSKDAYAKNLSLVQSDAGYSSLEGYIEEPF